MHLYINVNPMRVGSMGKGWGFDQKEKNLVNFLWVGKGTNIKYS